MTGFESIVTYWDSETFSGERAELSAEIARAFDAHLDIVAIGYEPDFPPYAFGGAAAAAVTEMFGEAAEQAERLADAAKARIEQSGVKGGAQPLVSPYSSLGISFGEIARYADLIVLSPPGAGSYEEAAVNLLEGVLFDGDAPALICPLGTTSVPGSRVVIGWNDSREALRAVRRAMPFLRRAEAVEIAVIDPGGRSQTPGEGLALMLSRHGVRAEIALLPSAAHSVSEALCQHALDRAADLLVMGAYSHSRVREYLLGGVTRDVLREVPVPVLLAH